MAQHFADDIAQLLNRTVANNVVLTATQSLDSNSASFGTIDRRNPNAPAAIRLEPRKRFAYVWLDFAFKVYRDDQDFLTVAESVIRVLTGPKDDQQLLFHYDYERDKGGYPDAHLQVCAESEPFRRLFESLDRPKDTVARLHFPVGGTRYRPAIEDVIEFLLRENLVAPRPGNVDVFQLLDNSRAEFRRTQLRAAVRRDPETALEGLAAAEYDVETPLKRTVRHRQDRVRKG